jgi:maltose operon periplasmic protein
MRHQLLITALFVATLVLGACGTVKLPIPLPTKLLPTPTPTKTLADAKTQLQQATPCCTSFADFSYQTLLPWRPQQFVLGGGSPVAAINGIRSYFLAFVLPTAAKMPYRVALKSELTGRSVSNSNYLFAPSVVLLDAAFQPIDSNDVKLCEYMGWSASDSGAFGSVTVNNSKARYMVVYSSGKQQADSTYWEQSAAAFSADASTPTNATTSGSYKIAHGPDGTVWVGMMDKNYASAVDKAVCGKAPQGDGVLNTLRTLPGHLSWSSL